MHSINIYTSELDYSYLRKTSNPVALIKGFRYKLVALLACRDYKSCLIKVGVELPDGSKIFPLDEANLRRSMGVYNVLVCSLTLIQS